MLPTPWRLIPCIADEHLLRPVASGCMSMHFLCYLCSFAIHGRGYEACTRDPLPNNLHVGQTHALHLLRKGAFLATIHSEVDVWESSESASVATSFSCGSNGPAFRFGAGPERGREDNQMIASVGSSSGSTTDGLLRTFVEEQHFFDIVFRFETT